MVRRTLSSNELRLEDDPPKHAQSDRRKIISLTFWNNGISIRIMKKPAVKSPVSRIPDPDAGGSAGALNDATKAPTSRVMRERALRASKIRGRYERVKGSLTERGRRLFVASEAIAFGYGGIVAVGRATGVALNVLGKGIAEVRAIENGAAPSLSVTRSRRPGGGRKKETERDPALLSDLKVLVESTTRGDPESPLLWTARSQRNIVAALAEQGHQASMNMVSRTCGALACRAFACTALEAGTRRRDTAPDRSVWRKGWTCSFPSRRPGSIFPCGARKTTSALWRGGTIGISRTAFRTP